jgi:hypothetical protein
VCPHCRQPLGWAGDCSACHGSAYEWRASWTFPGARYDFENGHWKLTDATLNRPVASQEDNASGMRVLAAMMRAKLGEPLPRLPRVRARDAAERRIETAQQILETLPDARPPGAPGAPLP